MFTEFLTPIDFINYYNVAAEIEKEKEDRAERAKREQYK